MEHRAELLAKLLLCEEGRQLSLPDYYPAIVPIIPELFGDCTPKTIPAMSPVVCNYCRKQVGNVAGLAVAVYATHPDCTPNFREPPWFKTGGFYLMAYAAFKHNKNSVELLIHYLILEHLKNEQRISPV